MHSIEPAVTYRFKVQQGRGFQGRVNLQSLLDVRRGDDVDKTGVHTFQRAMK